jgi:hypothetical protein
MGIFLLAADNEEVDQQWIEQEEREASAAIARAVQRYQVNRVSLTATFSPDHG